MLKRQLQKLEKKSPQEDSNDVDDSKGSTPSASSKKSSKKANSRAKASTTTITPAATVDASSSTSVSSLPSSRVQYTNRQRILVISSRGINARYRHLLEDLKQLLPHHKKDNKLDTKNNIQAINEIAEINSCNQVLYLECRKKNDLYLHLAHTPNGPSVKFHVVNIHTMDELKLTGNAMLGSRPLLNFDKKFDSTPQMMLIKSLLNDAFCTPNGHPKSKPFIDRIMCFYLIKNNIWIRNYQILEKSDRQDGKDTHLVEIGPRMVLIPIRIFSGSFGGATLYQNQAFVSPNDERSELKKRKGSRYTERIENKKQRFERMIENAPEPDLLSNTNVFK